MSIFYICNCYLSFSRTSVTFLHFTFNYYSTSTVHSKIGTTPATDNSSNFFNNTLPTCGQEQSTLILKKKINVQFLQQPRTSFSTRPVCHVIHHFLPSVKNHISHQNLFKNLHLQPKPISVNPPADFMFYANQ